MAPAYLILKLNRVDLPNGRLSVVYDQAGKARFVAMTNYFYQLVLKRVHDMVFDILKKRYLRMVHLINISLSRTLL